MEDDNRIQHDLDFLEHISNASPLGYYIYNIKTNKTVKITKNIFTMEPLAPDEKEFFSDIFNLPGMHTESISTVQTFLESFKRDTRHSHEVSFKCTCPRNKSCWYYTKASLYRYNENNEPELILGSILNVTKRIEFDKQLSKYESAVEQSPSVVIITDTNCKIEYANPQFTETTGYTFEEIAGKDPKVLKSGSTPIEYYSDLWKTLAAGKIWRGEFINKKKNGDEYWEYASITAIKDNHNDIIGYLKVAEDISDLKKTEKKLEKAKILAEQANKSKNEFLAHMSHEIRTPMNAILGYTQLLKSSSYPDPTFNNYLERIELSGGALLQLINDILDLSKLESHKMELHRKRVDMRRLCEEIKKIFSIQISEKGLTLKLTVNKECPTYIFVDEIRLRQILFNLVGNAVKFTPYGTICLTVATNAVKNNTIDMTIFVEDTGIGMSPEEQEFYFSNFFHNSNETNTLPGGSGLGLAITKRLVELMNGKIELESTPNRGSIFKIKLKGIEIPEEIHESSQEKGSVDQKTVSDSFNGQVLLLAEDNNLNRLLISSYLENSNISIIEAENGEIAIQKAEQYNPDIIFMDIKMPKMNGYQASKIIRKMEKFKDVPIIFLSATQTPEIEIDDLNVGNGFLLKPVSQESVFNILNKYLKNTKKESSKIPDLEAGHTFEELKSYPDEVVLVLKKSIAPEFEKGMKLMNNRFFKTIALQLLKLGEKHELPLLCSLGRKLQNQADTYDTLKIRKLYEYFIILVNNLPPLQGEYGNDAT